MNMIAYLKEMFSYPFMVRAAIVGILVSLCGAMLGASMVLKRYSMIGDGLSHVGFAALAIAYTLGCAPLVIAIPVCIAAAFLLLRTGDNSLIKGDAATAIMCSTSLAVGVMTVSLTTGMNTDVCNYMFGSILAMSHADVVVSVILSVAVVIVFILFYNYIFAVTFDETFARASGVRADVFNMILALLTAVTVVLGMRMMGTLLISSLLVFPSLSAMRICRDYKKVIIVSIIISLVCFCAGLLVSYSHAVPTGAGIVIANVIAFLICCLINKIRGCNHKHLRRHLIQIFLFVSCCLIGSGCKSSGTSSAAQAVKERKADCSSAASTDAAYISPDNTLVDNEGDEDQAAISTNTALDALDATSSPKELASYTPENKNAAIIGDSVYDCDIKADKADFNGNVDITVGDNYYATQINDWYLNFKEYEGMTVQIEGYYIDEYSPYLLIGRNGPSCPYCQGGYVSFEFYTDEDLSALKSGKDWLRVTGILRKGVDRKQGVFYYIEALETKCLPDTGKGTVTN